MDAVIISVPTSLHFTFIQQALQEGKHVLIEKPFVSSMKEVEPIKPLIKAKNVIVQVGHVERFNPVIQQLNKIINRPKMISIETRRLGALNRVIDIEVIFDLMIHDIDIVLSLVGSPIQSLSAVGYSLTESGQMDVANAVLTFKNGVIANLVANRLSQEKVRTLTITERDRLIKSDYMTKELFIYQKVDSVIEKNLSYRQESIVVAADSFYLKTPVKAKRTLRGGPGQLLQLFSDNPPHPLLDIMWYVSYLKRSFANRLEEGIL
ncbi:MULTISPECIES: Gfo/Idh/MocA family oxidoreductase [unclassified Paenibacillus]|uniref:Gfo/Idh/MocA family protein n=1 Tax=unclassified Paenibacillus TaxID=185978 RepID=UPI00240735D8|nr:MULTISPECIES: Gfo/Idh/MocA family oxidoreductase [unclassified Paenibacillus]MDF9843629.1 putative dehydrogenase [Paenibacillus sp. PastF-2]MDF9850217.1 putative dehydrogenase [Paenibacillus sp. PastM-2]MDF9856842.1 putative dehydrogenase [Paenibacillus sp. PastF-1]MDH6482064.1 putative dehydrogenase [Paenibacillus sp. PastH-2]MDH6509488.1 putative dehydrogenase [Paenibacillus sp. PastM-3]